MADDRAPQWAKMPTGQIHGGQSSDGPALKPVRPARLRPLRDWNTVVMELRGQSVRVTINGVVVQEADLAVLAEQGSLYPGLKRSSGRIGFQQHTGTARFRNIRAQALSSDSEPK